VPVSGIEITAHIDLDTLSLKPASHCSANDIAAASIVLGRPAAVDPFSELEETGTFLLVDALTGATLAAGIVVSASEGAAASNLGQRPSFALTRALLMEGLCSDLGASEADAREFRRRAKEVLRLLAAAGVAAAYEDPV
jgi:bifunctional enzyme CysN/CysC